MSSAPNVKKRSRGWCYTLNNEKEFIDAPEGADYHICGKELGKEEKTPHLQGYVHFPNAKSFRTVKRLLGKRAHIEAAKGTAEQNREYCSKDGDYRETGTLPRSGQRKDIDALYEAARAGKSDIEIGEANPAAYLRYYKAVDRVRLNYARQDNKFQRVKVYVYWGKAGSGKTRKVYKRDPDVYFVPDGDTMWWDGYVGQDAILFDDFYGGRVRYSRLLRLLDGYRFSLPVKGGFTWKAWKRVYITSNDHPRDWYHLGLTDALKRRLYKIKKF